MTEEAALVGFQHAINEMCGYAVAKKIDGIEYCGSFNELYPTLAETRNQAKAILSEYQAQFEYTTSQSPSLQNKVKQLIRESVTIISDSYNVETIEELIQEGKHQVCDLAGFNGYYVDICQNNESDGDFDNNGDHENIDINIGTGVNTNGDSNMIVDGIDAIGEIIDNQNVSFDDIKSMINKAEEQLKEVCLALFNPPELRQYVGF